MRVKAIPTTELVSIMRKAGFSQAVISEAESTHQGKAFASREPENAGATELAIARDVARPRYLDFEGGSVRVTAEEVEALRRLLDPEGLLEA